MMNKRGVLANLLKGRRAYATSLNNFDEHHTTAPLGRNIHVGFRSLVPAADERLRKKYLFIYINSMIGIILMILGLIVDWDSQTRRLIANNINLGFRITNTVLTAIIVAQLLDYYKTMLGIKVRANNYARGFGRVTSWIVFQYSGLGPREFLEIFIVCLHPFAPLHNVPFWGDEKWGVLMFLRLYMTVRILRDHSTIYKRRRNIGKMYIKHAPPKFDWFLSLKTAHFQRPIVFMFIVTVAFAFLFGYIIYVFEREIPDSKFTFIISLYVALLCMVSGWPADPFSIYNAQTFPGMLAGVGCCLMGLVLLAQLLEMVMSQLIPTPHDRPAIMYVARYNKKQKLRQVAAKLIQLIYRRHKKHIKMSPSQFFQQYTSLSRKFHLLQRELTTLEVLIAETQVSNLFVDTQTKDVDKK